MEAADPATMDPAVGYERSAIIRDARLRGFRQARGRVAGGDDLVGEGGIILYSGFLQDCAPGRRWEWVVRAVRPDAAGSESRRPPGGPPGPPFNSSTSICHAGVNRCSVSDAADDKLVVQSPFPNDRRRHHPSRATVATCIRNVVANGLFLLLPIAVVALAWCIGTPSNGIPASEAVELALVVVTENGYADRYGGVTRASVNFVVNAS